MSDLAPTLQAFFTERLINQSHASPRTVASYRDTLKMLLSYAQEHTGVPVSRLEFTNLDSVLIETFLRHLTRDRHNSARTSNTRLAAIRSFFRFAALHHPEQAELIQRVLAIPTKRFGSTIVNYLTEAETSALLKAPDTSRWIGRRDHTLMLLALQTGMRVSELTGLTGTDVHLGEGAYVSCRGKGRKERATPLTKRTARALRSWLSEQPGPETAPLFRSRHTGTALSSDAVQWLLAKHARTAREQCPTLQTKAVSPHVLRHTCAMNLLHAGVDISVISLWLGHADIRATQIYLEADLDLKEKALARTSLPTTPIGRYHPPDTLLAFLDAL